MNVERFCEVVRAARTSKLLTLAALAARVGTHKGYISGIENAKVNPPSPRMVKKMAKALNLNERRLLILAHAAKAPKEVRSDVERAVQSLLAPTA